MNPSIDVHKTIHMDSHGQIYQAPWANLCIFFATFKLCSEVSKLSVDGDESIRNDTEKISANPAYFRRKKETKR